MKANLKRKEKHMVKGILKGGMVVLAVPLILAGCSGGSSSGSAGGGGGPVGLPGGIVPPQPGPPTGDGGDFQILVNDSCVAGGARVLVNNVLGNFIHEIRADDQGYISLETVPDDGSIGVVHRYQTGSPVLPDFITVSHVDKHLLENATGVSVLSPLTRCLELTSPGLFTVTVLNDGDFEDVSLSGSGLAGHNQYTVNSGNVVALGYSSSLSPMYGIGSSAVAPGSTVPILIDRTLRQVSWQASSATPSNVSLSWAAGDTFAPISRQIPLGATSGILEMVNEPGALVAEAIYTTIDPISSTGYTVTQHVVSASLTESSVEFAGVSPSDVSSLALNDGNFTYQYTGAAQIKSVGITASADNMRHSYSTTSNIGFVDFPELPVDLQSKLSNVREITLRLESADPATYSAVFGVLTPLYNGQVIEAPYIDKVKYEFSQSFID